MFLFRKRQRVGPLTKKGNEAVCFPSPCRTVTSDPANIFVTGRPNQFGVNFDEVVPPTSISKSKNHLHGAGDFESTKASHLLPKSGEAFKRLFKSQQVIHRHQQKMTVREPPDGPEPTFTDKKGKSKRGFLERIYNKLKPGRKPFKSAEKDGQQAEQQLDVEAEQTDSKSVHTSLDHCSMWSSVLDQDQDFDYNIVSTPALNIQPKEKLKSSLVSQFTRDTFFKEIDVSSQDADYLIPTFTSVENNSSDIEEIEENSRNTPIKYCGNNLCEMNPEETFENMKAQAKDGSSQVKDSCQAGNTVMEDNSPGPLELHVGHVETVEGNTDTSGSYRQFRFKNDIFFFDMDPPFIENKQHSNANPAVGAEKSYMFGDTDTESMRLSYRISAKSAVTDQQLENKQDEDQEGPEYISSKAIGSNLFLDLLESPRQANTECPPNVDRRSSLELSFKPLSDNFERRVYRHCAEIYLKACLRQWREMKPRGSSDSATEGLTEPPTSSTECWTEMVPEKLSSQPEAPPRNVCSTLSCVKKFSNLVQKRLSQLFKIRIVMTI